MVFPEKCNVQNVKLSILPLKSGYSWIEEYQVFAAVHTILNF